MQIFLQLNTQTYTYGYVVYESNGKNKKRSKQFLKFLCTQHLFSLFFKTTQATSEFKKIKITKPGNLNEKQTQRFVGVRLSRPQKNMNYKFYIHIIISIIYIYKFYTSTRTFMRSKIGIFTILNNSNNFTILINRFHSAAVS